METENVRIECWVKSLRRSYMGEEFAGRFSLPRSEAEQEAISWLRRTPNCSRVTVGRDLVFAICNIRQAFENGNGTRTMVEAGQIVRVEGCNEEYRATAIA
jgi:hypothetical protein